MIRPQIMAPSTEHTTPTATAQPGIAIASDETLDALGATGLRIIQPRRGFRFTLDPLLLAAKVQLKPGERVVDLGTGTGIIPLLLAQRYPESEVVGIERQSEYVAQARRSVTLNRLEQRISIIQEDLRHCRERNLCQAFDVVVTNPPYRRPGTGRLAPDVSRAAARHEIHGTLDDFLESAGFFLKSGGRFYTIFLAERLPELLALMRSRRIEPKHLRCVQSRSDENAGLVLVEGRRNGRPGLVIAPPLILYEGTEYSREVLRITGHERGTATADGTST